MKSADRYDVIVVGGGNTALLTAVRAHEAGAKVLVLEKAPKSLRGGNGFFTTGLYRIVHNGIKDLIDLVPDLNEEERGLIVHPYTADEFFRDYTSVTEGLVDPEFMEMIIEQSTEAIRWMVKRQIFKMEVAAGFIRRIDGKLHFVGMTPVQAKGGGAGLSENLYGLMEQKSIDLMYETGANHLLVDGRGKVQGVSATCKGEHLEIKSKSVVLACGGFEANPMMRAQYLGKDWDLVKVRGTRFNMGDGLKMALEIGAKPYGHWSGCHATFIEADAPQPAIREETEKTAKRFYYFGMIVNLDGKRFLDEGEDEPPLTYARFGQYAIEQPQRIALHLFDAKGYEVITSRAPLHDYVGASCTRGDTIEEIADKLGIDQASLCKTVKDYNEASRPGGKNLPHFKLTGLPEDRKTVGISPPKSSGAIPLDTPPLYAYPTCCGITFTYGGLKVNKRGQVLDGYDKPIPGLYAAGEIIGGLFYNNYPGATGQLTGAVFARISGANAATD